MAGRWRSRLLVTCSLLLPLALSSCAAPDESALPEKPASVDQLAGTDLRTVRLTESAAVRLGIRTEPVAVADSGFVVPSAAVFITPDGKYWVYTSPEPLFYIRQEIRLVVEKDLLAFFAEGPAPGTQVVTTGVPELYGTEFGVGK